jgi:citrate lyase subunit beta/citryl-CoA lyase
MTDASEPRQCIDYIAAATGSYLRPREQGKPARNPIVPADRIASRSLLFVPGHQPARFDKALRSGADEVVLDLEDAVPPEQKESARSSVRHWLDGLPAGTDGPESIRITVRVNAVDTAWHAGDLAVCAHPRLHGLMIPKSEHGAAIATIANALPGRALLPLIETARGIARIDEIAAGPGVWRLVFGTVDFQADMNIDGDGDELLMFRSRIVLASRIANLQAPVDGVSTVVHDAAGVEATARGSRRLGFGGKLCIHPAQVASVNAAFLPSAAQVDWARRVIAASYGSGGSPVVVDGAMVDRPVVLKAQFYLHQLVRTEAD